MIAQGTIEIYVVEGEALGADFTNVTLVTSILEFPDKYTINTRIILSFDFAPLSAWKIYKSVANQYVAFNASEWTYDYQSPFAAAVQAASNDGMLTTALADGKIVIFDQVLAPTNPGYYDVWKRSANDIEIGLLSAEDQEAISKSTSDVFYFYWSINNQWVMCSSQMEAAIANSVATQNVKSVASVWNTVNVSGMPYVNGWQSIIEYQNNHLLKNDFAIVADNFYIGSVGNITQSGIDAMGNPVYTATGESYKPFTVDTVNHRVKFDGVVEFSNTLNKKTSLLTNDLNWTDDTTANAAVAAASAAQTTANAASTNATSALTQLTNIASDNILSPSEKPSVILDYNTIIAEQTGIDAQATAYAITTEKTAYDTAVSALTTYLGTLTAPTAWNILTGDTTIVGTTFRTKFQDVYTTRQTLLNKIYSNAKAIADSKLSSSSDLAALINAGTTTINGGQITTGSILSTHIAAQQIKTVNLETGIQILNGYIASSDFLSIGGTGFRLKSNAAGTSVDPTIYGAYIKGGVFDGTKLVASNGSNQGRLSYSKTEVVNQTISSYYTATVYTTPIRVYSPNYGSGFLDNRVTSLTESIFTVFSSGAMFRVVYSGTATITVIHTIEISVDDGAYYKLDQFTTGFGVDKSYSGVFPAFNSTIDIRLKIDITQNGSYELFISNSITFILSNM